MKLISTLLFSSFTFAQVAATAQTPAPAKPHSAARAHTTAAASGCVKLPPLSPKIPALPAAAPCAKGMYTLTTVPQVKIGGAPPALAASVGDYLGIEPVSFTLAYIDTKIGSGAAAEPHKWYSVLYTGYLQDGTVFDSSAKHPEMGPFVLQQGAHGVIPGWDTGFYGMRVGGKRRLFIPHQLAYGFRGNGAVPPNADLIFDVELVNQSDKNPTPAPKTPPAPPAAATPATPPPATQSAPAPVQPATAPTAAPPKPQ